MFQNLTGLALGIVIFAIVVGVGLVVLVRFGNSVGGTANTTIQGTNGLTTHLGTEGLVGWTPAIIALAIGLLFIGALIFKGRKY